MGLFWSNKPKISPIEFIDTQISKIFCDEFVTTELRNKTELFGTRSQSIDDSMYIKELRQVICTLLKVAWAQSIPDDVFIKYGLLGENDNRVKMVNSGVYDQCLTNAQTAGVSTFSYITNIFLNQINISEQNYGSSHNNIYLHYGTYFQSLYQAYVEIIKSYKYAI